MLSGSDITAYVAYMAAVEALFVMGENSGFLTRDNSILALITAAGGGTIVLENNSADTQTVQAPFTGPVTLATLTFAAIGGFTSPGHGAFITEDSNGTTVGDYHLGPGR